MLLYGGFGLFLTWGFRLLFHGHFRLFRYWLPGFWRGRFSFGHLSPHLALLGILFHQNAVGITVSKRDLCHLESAGSRFCQIDECLVIVTGYATSVHVAIGQVELSLGKTLRRTPLKPSCRSGVILLGSLTVIVSIAEVELCLCIAQTGCFCIFGHCLLELSLLIQRVALGKMPGCSHLGRVGIKYGGMGG